MALNDCGMVHISSDGDTTAVGPSLNFTEPTNLPMADSRWPTAHRNRLTAAQANDQKEQTDSRPSQRPKVVKKSERAAVSRECGAFVYLGSDLSEVKTTMGCLSLQWLSMMQCGDGWISYCARTCPSALIRAASASQPRRPSPEARRPPKP